MQNTTDDLEQEPGMDRENTPSESVYDAYQPEPPIVTMGEDGFPIEHDPPGDPGILPLTPENLCCMEQPNDEMDGVRLPRCIFYIRQLIPLDDLYGRKAMRRLCSNPLFKTLSGAGMSLTDDGVFACEAREPADPKATEELDRRDRRTSSRATGDRKSYRLFPTPEEAKSGKHTLAPDETVEGERIMSMIAPGDEGSEENA